MATMHGHKQLQSEHTRTLARAWSTRSDGARKRSEIRRLEARFADAAAFFSCCSLALSPSASLQDSLDTLFGHDRLLQLHHSDLGMPLVSSVHTAQTQ